MKPVIPAVLAVAIALASPTSAYANLQQQVNEMYGAMINVTAPGAYETATRGAVSGGGLTLRNRISTANLIAITPPSAKGGCGGINLYSGSFSFINGEEFVALMRNVASNAVGVVSGFAFEMAIEAMDSATNGVLRNLTNKIQSLNQMFSNSCQLAQGIVQGTADAFKEKRDLKSAMTGIMDNVAPDFFSSKSTKEESPGKRIVSAGKAKSCSDTGNVTWCAMKKTGLASQIMFGSDENAEFILSMVGSFNVSLKNDDRGGQTFAAEPIAQLEGATLELFVEGTNGTPLQLYKCDTGDTDQCLEPSIRTVTDFKGLEKKIVEDLRLNGVLERFYDDQIALSDRARLAWLGDTQVGINLFKITRKAGPEAGYNYLSMFSKHLAAEASYKMIVRLLDITERGLDSIEMADAVKVKQAIVSKRAELLAEKTDYINKYGAYKDVNRAYLEIMENAPNLDQGKMLQGTVNESAGG
ncbi:conjugal transfer protein TraH [Aquipseudomonas alcaligenes]|uniref:Conjugative transfer pilus assembly protein TraH n=1 Tax=Aquipseudomonas alcaligenes TaxID=43263 RepID=A0A1N6XF90_AQUAC|nr:conjugal transfer protein TraH [Pseudomonas alcaligenes]SIR01014.1 conjugative transfer pilus assembly protein TraH [Pseudomonas alcaligenes]